MWRPILTYCSPQTEKRIILWQPIVDLLLATSMILSVATAHIKRLLSGRRAEQEILTRLLRSERSEFLALYGRRRVGKTFLVRRFFQDQPINYFEMVGRFEGSLADQLRVFSESLSEAFYRGAPIAPPTTWHEALRQLRAAIERSRSKKKFVLFFDELPWIATHRSGCLRELEHLWNAWCSRRDDIILIVCGSAASWMLKKIVNARGGLHGRVTQTIRRLPFSLRETTEYFDDRKIPFTSREVIELYMCLGGVPHYLDHVDRGRSVAQHIDRICLDRNGALVKELDRLFASLFDADEKYTGVVRALARKRRGLTRNEILESAGLVSGGGATAVLENLQEGGFTSSSLPLDRTSRDKIYRLTDEFLLFYMSWLRSRRPRSWQQVRGTPRWRAWAGLAFEALCQKHTDSILRELGISGIRTDTSSWLHPDAQIDLLIDRADGVISVCEMKFTESPFTITKKYAGELRRKIDIFREQAGTKKNIHLVFVTSYGLNPNKYSDELVDGLITMDALLS